MIDRSSRQPTAPLEPSFYHLQYYADNDEVLCVSHPAEVILELGWVIPGDESCGFGSCTRENYQTVGVFLFHHPTRTVLAGYDLSHLPQLIEQHFPAALSADFTIYLISNDKSSLREFVDRLECNEIVTWVRTTNDIVMQVPTGSTIIEAKFDTRDGKVTHLFARVEPENGVEAP